MNVTVETRVKRKICNAKTGHVEFESAWEKNLVVDQGLNCLARRPGIANIAASTPAGFFTNILVGSGTNPVKTSSGAITFTQSNGAGAAGTILVASGGFFTSAMVGCIFKYGTGTGGTEVYITAFTSATQVTVGTSLHVTVATVGAVWFVQQTALQTLYTPTGTKSYQTTAGDCQTTIAGSVITHKRTFVIPQQAASYNVNEIGYGPNGVTSNVNALCGRLVLSATDVVSTSNFYVVILEIAFTYSPGSPTAVGNVGTNIDTTGTAMIEAGYGFAYVDAAGGVDSHSSRAMLDGTSTNVRLNFATASWTQASSIPNGDGVTITKLTIPTTQNWTWISLGLMELNFTGSATTAGQTLYGCGIDNNQPSWLGFTVKFTTPVTAPTGTFQPNTIFRTVYARNLSN